MEEEDPRVRRSLIAAVPVDELKSAALTGRWEARLGAIAEGRDDRAAFMDAVRARTAEIVAAIAQITRVTAVSFPPVRFRILRARSEAAPVRRKPSPTT